MRTAKIIIPAVIILTFLIVLSSCGTLSGVLVKEKSNETTQESYTPQNSETDDTQWIDAYKNYLLDLIEQDEAEADRFSLIYLDDNDIPELVVSEGDYHAAQATLIVFYKGKLLSFSDLGSWGAFQYYEKKGIIGEGYTQGGCNSSSIWKLTNGSLQCLWSGWDNQGVFEDDSKWEYYLMDTKTVEAYHESPTDSNYEKMQESETKVSADEYNETYFENVPTGLDYTSSNDNLIGLITRKNVIAYFEALAEKDSIPIIHGYEKIKFSGTISEKQTDYDFENENEYEYYDFQLDRPVIVQFEGEEFPPLLTVIRISESDFDDWNLTTGHTSLQGSPARNQEDGYVWLYEIDIPKME